MKINKFIMVLLVAAACLSGVCFAAAFERNRTFDKSFSDIPSSAWFADDVKTVYELSLMEGVSETLFDSDGNMSVGQAVTIASRIHSLYYGSKIRSAEQDEPWYQPYVDYALAEGIIFADFDSYTRNVKSHEMVSLFVYALPTAYFPKINETSHIPDVSCTEEYYYDVLMFYNAGVLNGDEKGNFLPNSTITRKRAAAIIARTVLPEKRIKFSLPVKNKTSSVDLYDYTPEEVYASDIDSNGGLHMFAVYSTNVKNTYMVELLYMNTADYNQFSYYKTFVDTKTDLDGNVLDLHFDDDGNAHAGHLKLTFLDKNIKYEVYNVHFRGNGYAEWKLNNGSGILKPSSLQDIYEPEAPAPSEPSEPSTPTEPSPTEPVTPNEPQGNTPYPDQRSESYANDVIYLVNLEREKNGLSPLGTDDTLASFAMVRANELLSNFSHTRPDGSSCFTVIKNYSYRTCGENVAAGQRTPAEVVNSWMNSEGHRENILNPEFTKIGVGYASAGSGYGHYWVQLFVG